MQAPRQSSPPQRPSKVPWLMAAAVAGALMIPAAAQACPRIVIRHVIPSPVIVIKTVPAKPAVVRRPALRPAVVKVLTPKPLRVWVPGHWLMRHGHRVWVPGHWKLR